jgi:O-antigen/teichoic acid export membrane protein
VASDDRSPASADEPLRSAARGGGLNLAGFVASGVLGFVLAIAITRGLGEEGAGVFFAAIAVFTILSNVMELGADTGMVRFVARLRALGRSADLRRTVLVGLVPVAIIGIVVGVMTFAAAPSIARVFASDRQEQVTRFLRLIAPLLPFATVSTVVLAGTRGFGTMVPFVAIEGFGKPMIRPLAVIALSLGGLATAEVALAWSLPEALGCAAAIAILARLLRANGTSEPSERSSLRSLAREFWAFSAPRSLGAAFQVTVVYVDLLILGHFRSTAEVGVYGAASRIVTVGTFALQAVRLAIAPHVSAMLTRDDRDGARELYQTATWWLMAISWPLFLALASFAPFLLGVFGPGFASGQTALLILSLAMLVNLGTGNVSMVLLMGGRSGWQLLNQGVSLAVNIALNLWLIPRHGMTGAAIAWGVAIALDNLMAVAEVRYLFGIGPFGPGYGVVVATTVACFGAGGLAFRLLLGANLWSFSLYAILSCAAFAFALWRWRDDLRLDVLLGSFGRGSRPSEGSGDAGRVGPGAKLPGPVRDLARTAVRAYGKATASLRPLPEFLLIGTKRGGTTSLAAYLHEHPDVAPLFPRIAVPKGVRYFDDHYVEGPRWYRSHFPSTFARRGGRIAGEATAHYLFDPRAAERAHRLVPDARIIVLLRDPVERAYSHHRERTRQGFETLTFEEALAAEPERLAGELDRMLADPAYVSFEREHHSYRAQGCYIEYLPAWVQRYGRDRVLVIVSERFFEDPAREHARALSFLGLAPHEPTYKAHNFHPMQRGIEPAVREQLDAFYEPFTRRLEEYLGIELPWGARRKAAAGGTEPTRT